MDGATIIEVVAIQEKTKKVYVSEKTYAEWLVMEKKENYIYTAFQKGKQRFKFDEQILDIVQKKAKPNLSKIKDVDKWIDEIKGNE